VILVHYQFPFAFYFVLNHILKRKKRLTLIKKRIYKSFVNKHALGLPIAIKKKSKKKSKNDHQDITRFFGFCRKTDHGAVSKFCVDPLKIL
jgi:hypothetical protein